VTVIKILMRQGIETVEKCDLIKNIIERIVSS
jgi:hypothetical protein